jgi:hypothetical protein
MLVALQFKGLVAKTVEVPDGGEVQLTSIGAAYLAHDPVNRLAAALERMPPGHAAELGRLVEYVSDHLSADECVHGL